MKRNCISKGWMLNSPGTNGQFVPVDLPNDYSITLPRSKYAPGSASNGFFMGGTGTYIKKMVFQEKPKHYILNIDGAYMCTQVKINNKEIDFHPHGYTPYLLDLTEHIIPGENSIIITTNAIQQSTRWYSGAGIYRDVFMWEGGDIRIEPWDLFISTPTLKTVNAAYKISADRDANAKLHTEIFDRDGDLIATKETPVSIKVGKTSVYVEFEIPDAHVWNMDDPYLYTMRSTVIEGDNIADIDEQSFGIRTVTADAIHGLRINGKTVKLRGGCIHHDHGVLGAADYPAACRRKLQKLKNAGFNALRIAHNPPSELLLQMCDEMGIIIMDEAFDCWAEPKGGLLNYHNFFEKHWESDIECMVLRDRRHPCVICYSTGNEIPESSGSKIGYRISALLASKIRSLDSTRLVTVCTWGIPGKELDNRTWEERTAEYFAPYDICGYNYFYTRYEKHRKMFPERVIWGSETHVMNFYDSWNTTLKNPHVIGDFTWTAYDNLGEAGTGRAEWARDGIIKGITLAEYPWRSCYQGDLDLCGFRRPQSYFREAVWIGNTEPRIFTTHPEHYNEGFSGTGWHWYDVHETWTFADEYLGKPVKCETYTDADEIEWILNGKVIGRSQPISAIASIDISYERGELIAVAYKNGAECGRFSLHTVKEAKKIMLKPETKSVKADNRDLCYIEINITDENENRITDSNAELKCTVKGGELMGIFSANPKNEDQYGSNICHAFDGRAIAIIRSKTNGTVTVTVESDGLSSALCEIRGI